jgi:selenocysteine lyase/cysteine desulfurase
LGPVGFDRIADHVAGLTQKFLKGARELQIQTKTPPDSQGPLVVLRMKDAEAMVKKLAERDIVVSNRMDGLRVSFHVYNTVEDVQAVLSVLEQNKNLTVQESALV